MDMSQTFEELISELRPDVDAIQQAARFYVAERSGDLDGSSMRAKLIELAGDDPREINAIIDTLEVDGALVEAACITVLADAWEDPANRGTVRGCLEDAKAQMPIVETAIIAIVAAYGMYLLATGGAKKIRRVTKREADGSIKEVEVVEYEGPLAPLKAIMMLGKSGPK